ncbi:GFA family protein [Shinella zoogloeoides]|uniref:GFA family protein n=1 Tax=Shinella zoogloeoides TaxID=352475 RepID=UPI0028A93832|nr:GFA family protein [Shinella zoogloeoides]
MTKRKAMCSCGALAIVAQGEPGKISVCHCLECQRRTGSAFGIAVFFATEATDIIGSSALFSRTGDSGQPIEFHFCRACGSTVFWRPAFRPGVTAIAFGCFEDKEGLEPTQSVYDAYRHSWVTVQTP